MPQLDPVSLEQLFACQRRPKVLVEFAHQLDDTRFHSLVEPPVAYSTTFARHQPSGAVALVGCAQSRRPAGADAEQLAGLHPR